MSIDKDSGGERNGGEQGQIRNKVYKSTGAGLFLLLIFGMILGISVFLVGQKLVTLLTEGEWEPFQAPVNAAIITLIGLGGVLLGVRVMLRKTETVVDAGKLWIRYRGVFKSKSYNVPLSEYEGVVYYFEKGFDFGSRMPVVQHILALHHQADSAKSAMLQREEQPASSQESLPEVENKWADYCRLTGLPGIDERGGETEVRESRDVGKPLKEVVSEESASDEQTEKKAPPSDLSVSHQAGDVIITALRGPIGIVGGVLFLVGALFCVLLMMATIYGGNLVMAAVFFIAAALGMVTLPFAVIRRHQHALRVSPDSVEYGLNRDSGFELKEKLDAEEVTRITIEKPGNSSMLPDALCFRGKDEKFFFGQRLPKDALEWIRTYVLETIKEKEQTHNVG